MKKKEIGRIGEEYAEKFLASKNYTTIRKNYYCKWGEIDLIMLTPAAELVFVEVKTRIYDHIGTAEESITYKKVQRLIKTAMTFLQQCYEISFVSWRIDLIALKLDQEIKFLKVKHYKNILDGN